MPYFPDKRGRYAGVAPWDFAAGMGHPDNPTKSEAKTTLATRVPDTYEQNEKGEHVLVPGNKTPRDNFRTTTQRGRQNPQLGSEQPVNSALPTVAKTDSVIGDNLATSDLRRDIPVPKSVLSADSDSAEGTPSVPSGTGIQSPLGSNPNRGSGDGTGGFTSTLAKDSLQSLK